MKRRTFIKTCITGTLACMAGSVLGLSHIFRKIYLKARQPTVFTGQIQPLDPKKISKPSRWKG